MSGGKDTVKTPCLILKGKGKEVFETLREMAKENPEMTLLDLVKKLSN